MDRLTLTPQQRQRLECQAQETTDARVYQRTLAVLEYSRGRSVAQIAETLGVTRQSVYNWLNGYAEEKNPEALVADPQPGRPRVWTPERQVLLRTLMSTPPDRLGALAANWTVPLLQDVLQQKTGERFSEDTIRRELRRQDYVWKRPRYVLQPDPEKEKKTLDPSIFAANERGRPQTERGIGGR